MNQFLLLKKTNKPLSKNQLLILETLSFFEPMTKEKLLLDFDMDKLINAKDFTVSDLENGLDKLVKARFVSKSKKNNEVYYQRIYPKKSVIDKIWRLLKHWW